MTDEIPLDPSFRSRTSLIQLGYGLWVSLSTVGIGLAMGFPAVTIPQLVSPGSGIAMTTSDESWIASILTLVAPIGCILCGILMDRYGRRINLIICELPMCFGWMCTGLATSANIIIIGRLITGVGVGMTMGAPRIYNTEISLPNMRGVIGAFPNLAMSMGFTVQALLGGAMKWNSLCFVCFAYTFLLSFLNYFLPETPYFALLKGREEDAKIALQKFRAKDYDIDRELDEMMEFKMANDIRSLSLKSQVCLLFTKAACKPFFIISVYFLITQLAGVTIIFVWTINFLESSKSSLDPNTGNFLMGVTRFVVGIITSILLFHMGRKPLALISSFGVAFVCLLLGSLNLSSLGPTVLPPLCFVLYVIFATLGYYTLPLLVMSELYPLQIRGLLSGISISFLNFMIFSVNYAFPYVRNAIGHAKVILGFGLFSLLGAIYLYFFLPETMGLTLTEIEEYFNDRRATLTSQRSIIAAQLSQARSLGNVPQTSSLKQISSKKHSSKELLRAKKKKSMRDVAQDNLSLDSKHRDRGGHGGESKKDEHEKDEPEKDGPEKDKSQKDDAQIEESQKDESQKKETKKDNK